MSPSSNDSCYLRDWVLSLGSNVHVATDQGWFTTLTKLDSHVGKAPHLLEVKGIGVVELELDDGGNGNSYKLVLDTVLYVPGYFCNVIGGPIISSDGHKYNIDFNTAKLTTTATGEPIGIFETRPFMHLRLSDHKIGWSTFEDDDADQLRIHVTWPGEEQCRWKAFVAGEEYSEPAVSAEPPLDDAEKAWVKKTYKHEYRFLAQHGLSIHVQDDRMLGWKLARKEMKRRAATEDDLAKELKQSANKLNRMPPTTSSIKDMGSARGKENQAPDGEAPTAKPKGRDYIPPHMRVLLGIKAD